MGDRKSTGNIVGDGSMQVNLVVLSLTWRVIGFVITSLVGYVSAV